MSLDIKELLNKLQKVTFNHITDKIIDDGEQDTSDLINLVINSHLNSLFLSMTQLADSCDPPNPLMKVKVMTFIERMAEWTKENIPK